MRGNAKVIFGLSILSVFFATTGFSCTLGNNPDAKLFDQITLEYWRVFDDRETIEPLLSAYAKLHPNVTINYRLFRYEEYEPMLLDAFAEDRGPDIFSIPNSWVDRYRSKITALPAEYKIGNMTVQNKKVTKEVKVRRGLTGKEVRELFVDTVSDDVTRPGKEGEEILGLPYFVDTLALFYNKDMLNNESIDAPPANWAEFEEAVEKVTKVDEDTQGLIQSGAALGSSANVQRATDILASLMMQNGAEMARNGTIWFHKAPIGSTQETNPGANALQYYTDFASPLKQYYTWDDEFAADSFEAFAQSKTAFFFGYSYHSKLLNMQAPRLRYGIVPIPQIGYPNPRATVANYWVETVSRKSPHQNYAWDFIQFAAQKDQIEGYLQKTGRPTALRSLVDKQKDQEELSAFALQLPYAKNWYHGKNPRVAEKAFQELITSGLNVKSGDADEERGQLEQLVNRAAAIVEAGYSEVQY